MECVTKAGPVFDLGRLAGSICLLKVQICQRNRRGGGNVGNNEVVSTFPWVWDLSGNNASDGIDLGNPIITTGEKMRHSKLLGMNLTKQFRFVGSILSYEFRKFNR